VKNSAGKRKNVEETFFLKQITHFKKKKDPFNHFIERTKYARNEVRKDPSTQSSKKSRRKQGNDQIPCESGKAHGATVSVLSNESQGSNRWRKASGSAA
jgi:hypothetical protein